MPKKYDAATKWLIDLHPQDWLRLVGVVAEEVETVDADLLDTDLSTVTSAADGVFHIRRPVESMHHVELETGHHGSEKPADLLNFSVLATRKYHLPVETSLIVLRREANSPALTGRLEYLRPDGTVYLRFEYNVIRIWEIPVDALLEGGLGTLPLAPIAKVTQSQLPAVIRRMEERLEAEAGPEIGEIWTATKILMGLRYTRALTDRLLRGVKAMRESVTYQEILEEGEARGEARGEIIGEQKMLIKFGSKRLGMLSPQAESQIAAITSFDRLSVLAERVWDVETWDELLADVN